MIRPITVRASAMAATWVIWLVVAVTVWAEMAPGFKAWLASLTGHHWVTKGWMSIIAYLALLLAFRSYPIDPDEAAVARAMYRANVSCVAGLLVLLAFYYWHM